MRSRGKTRSGLILVTSSTILILITVVILVSGIRYSDQVLYDESDFELMGDTLVLTIENDLPGVVQYSVDSDDDLRVSIKVLSPGGRTIHSNKGNVPLTGQATLDRSGSYTIEIEVQSISSGTEDLDIEIRSTGGSIILTCCGVLITGMLSFLLLLIGGIVTIMAIKEGRR